MTLAPIGLGSRPSGHAASRRVLLSALGRGGEVRDHLLPGACPDLATENRDSCMGSLYLRCGNPPGSVAST